LAAWAKPETVDTISAAVAIPAMKTFLRVIIFPWQSGGSNATPTRHALQWVKSGNNMAEPAFQSFIGEV
jgi:hypothetical protein